MTKQQQEGGFLGTLLASIGIPLLMKAITGKGHGSGLHIEPRLTSSTIKTYVPKTGRGKKKGKGLLLGKNSPFSNIPIIGDIL